MLRKWEKTLTVFPFLDYLRKIWRSYATATSANNTVKVKIIICANVVAQRQMVARQHLCLKPCDCAMCACCNLRVCPSAGREGCDALSVSLCVNTCVVSLTLFVCFCVRVCLSWTQNFFKDRWNMFDFITVIGSIVDAIATEIQVSSYRGSWAPNDLLVATTFVSMCM